MTGVTPAAETERNTDGCSDLCGQATFFKKVDFYKCLLLWLMGQQQ